MFQRSPAALAAAMLSLAVLGGCTSTPDAAWIEAVAMEAGQRADPASERQLAAWAARGVPVAQRELGMLYRTRPGLRAQAQARTLLTGAARQGDAEAAFQLGELERAAGASAAAAPWYRQAAVTGHAKAALMLALLLKNGEGIERDMRAAAYWLGVAAAAGNAHAMFLLSNAYVDGDGVAPDPKRARVLLEDAAEREYPAAIQQLAMIKETGDTLSRKDSAAAAQLLKEAAEHRRSNARRF